MRILSWNTNGLLPTLKDASVRYSSPSHFFAQVLQADILCFQESKIQEEKLERWLACVPGYESFWAFSTKKKGFNGVVTYVKEELSPLAASANFLGNFDDPDMEELCSEGRLVESDHGSFILINVYVPNAGLPKDGRPRLNFKLKFLEALRQRCDEHVNAGKHLVVVGDFNIAHRQIDVCNKWKIEDIYSPEELTWIDAFFMQYVDLFRHFHPDARDIFSVWDSKTEARIHNEGVRIDYAVCDKGFLSEILDTQIIKMVPKKWSDHAAVFLTLKEQPLLPKHPIPALSSRNMKQFQEDQRQKKITAVFACALKGNTIPDIEKHLGTINKQDISSNDLISSDEPDSSLYPVVQKEFEISVHKSYPRTPSVSHLIEMEKDATLLIDNRKCEYKEDEIEMLLGSSGNKNAPAISCRMDSEALISESQGIIKDTAKEENRSEAITTDKKRKSNTSIMKDKSPENRSQKKARPTKGDQDKQQRNLTLYFSKT